MTAPDFHSFQVEEHPVPPGVRVLGEGFVGGKALGLFLAATLQHTFGRELAGRYAAHLRIPPTVVLRSSYYESFLAWNRLEASARQAVSSGDHDPLRLAFLAAPFPDEARATFRVLLRDLVDVPLAVRSSSRLEDSLRASFAGIYLTRFIPNLGPMEERLAAFEAAVKDVFASTFTPAAVAYRRKRGLRWQDEGMSIVVQPMVGRRRGRYFFPLVGGVAFSRNYYPWSERLQPADGVVRLVYGLGTQAVDRGYARVLSPAWPSLRPEGQDAHDIVRYAQREFDALDVEAGRVETLSVHDAPSIDQDVWKLASVLEEGQYLKELIGRPDPRARLVMTFQRAIRGHFPLPFVPLLRELLQRLEEGFGVPVDVEFALSLDEDASPGEGLFHLLQVRPLQTRPDHEAFLLPDVAADRTLVTTKTAMGNGAIRGLRHAILVSPDAYAQSPAACEAAREVGRLNAELGAQGYVLIGPGRWGTQNATLGVPVSYAEICHARAIVEVSGGPFTPEFSYGTHFFGDLAADQTVYMAVFPDQGDACTLEKHFDAARPTRHPAVRLATFEEGITCVVDGRARRGIVFIGPPADGPPDD